MFGTCMWTSPPVGKPGLCLGLCVCVRERSSCVGTAAIPELECR